MKALKSFNLLSLILISSLFIMVACSKDEEGSSAPATQSAEDWQRQQAENQRLAQENYLNGTQCGYIVQQDFQRLKQICSFGQQQLQECANSTRDFLQKYPGVHCTLNYISGNFNQTPVPQNNTSAEGRLITHGHLQGLINGIELGLHFK